MSIKLKLALYNTFLVGIVMIFVLVFMLSMSNSVVQSTTKNQLMFLVHDNAEEVEWDDGKLELDDVNLYENHYTTLVYSHDGHLLAGRITNIEDFTAPLTHGELKEVTIQGEDYLIYDFFVESRKYNGVFLRGIVSVLEVAETVETLFFFTLLALPFFILFAGLGSFLIAKRSMKPLEKIIDTAEEISNGDNLSLRIALGKGKDEIHHLAETFDTMFIQLEQAFLAEKQFSSDVSHELRTPTAVILAECECNLTGTEAEKTEALITIQRQGRKMQQLIGALLNLIRLDSGVQKVNLEELDFSELLSIVCEEQLLLMPENLQLQTEIQENLTCWADYSMMIRVISNLMDNAIKYGKDGGFVRVTLQDQENSLLLQVEDDGIGISEQHLGQIFQRFYRVDSARTRESTESMGLGLSMVLQMIKLHQGTIHVKSQEGAGTCFSVTLPKKPKNITP